MMLKEFRLCDEAYIIRLIEDADRLGAQTLIDNIALHLYGCRAPLLPQVTFVAVSSGNICGVIGLVPVTDVKASVLNHYDLVDDQLDKLGYFSLVEIVRWFSTIPDLAVPLMRVAIGFALEKGHTVGIAEMKPAVYAHACSLGMPLVLISDTLVRLETMDLETSVYYLTLPPPSLYSMLLPDVFDSLAIHDHSRAL